LKNLISKILLKCRKLKYSFFSTNSNLLGTYIAHQPVVCRGKGTITFGNNVNMGVINAPYFYNEYAYLEARNQDASLLFGNNIHINNGFSAIAEKSIVIEDDVLIGYHCNIIDSDFHNLNPEKRNETDPNPQEIIIKKNVFIGNNVTILKGVVLGENSVVANGAVVSKSFPENVVIGGVPAKIISKL